MTIFPNSLAYGQTPNTTVDFTARSSFLASTNSLVTVGFNGILPSGLLYQNFNPLTLSGISFSTPSSSNTFVNVTTASYYSPHNYSAAFITNSVNQNTQLPNIDNELIITLPAATHALAFDFGALGFNGSSSAIITLSNGHVFSPPHLSTVGQTSFFGFISTDPITTVTIAMNNDSWIVEDLLVSSSTLQGDAVATLARSVVGDSYIEGAKGWDWQRGLFVDSGEIGNGYNYLWSDHSVVSPGLDCSGLVFWAYNKVAGATQNQTPQRPGAATNPVLYEGADGQYWNNSVDVSAIEPGDLLFFDYNHDGQMDHVEVYVGGSPYDTVSASTQNLGIQALKSAGQQTDPGFVGFRRVSQALARVRIVGHSPIDLTVTDPDGLTINADTTLQTAEEILHEIPRNLYYSRWGLDADGSTSDAVISPQLKIGMYIVKPTPKRGINTGALYSLDFWLDNTDIVLAQNSAVSSIPTDGFGVLSDGSTVVPVTPIQIALEAEDRRINTCSDDLVRVVVFSSRAFDATMIDPRTVTFAGATPTASHEHHDKSHHVAVVFAFSPRMIQLSKGRARKAVFRGETRSGQLIGGQLSVRVVCSHDDEKRASH